MGHGVCFNSFFEDNDKNYDFNEIRLCDIEFSKSNNKFNLGIKGRENLSKLHGVYILRDTLNDKKYIGSTYRSSGIAGKMYSYHDGAGESKLLRALRDEIGNDEFHRRFTFAILEYINPVEFKRRSNNKYESYLVNRENYFKKNILPTDPEEHYNRN
ncbi:hypothetical protein OGZ32_04935 [Lactococcus lactis]|uniref:hypothetical protein n=1 Tax=Lactococcus lactis TaxID=1358 RepID=UPI002415992C|nr:hypothetical protein [Lactococcus lactis]MDG4954681.1 hypothetical protein [Lactococcus lactis]